MDDVLRHVPLTRVTLKRRFERLLGRSPKAEIMRLQLEKVKQLLAETELTQAEIARLAGFRYLEYMSAAFRGGRGQTPGQYRRSSAQSLLPAKAGKAEEDDSGPARSRRRPDAEAVCVS